MRAAPAALLALVTASLLVTTARAGGDFVDLAVSDSRVWFVGGGGVHVLDARTGRTVATPQLVGTPYPLSVTVAGGAAWVASVENGYVFGTLTRVDARTGEARVVWRRANRSVLYAAAGAGGVWALIGSARGGEVARFGLDGRLERVWKLADAGRMAADGSGCWISATGRLLHIDPAGRVHTVLRAPLGDVATGGGAVWLPRTTSVLRIDERTGAVRTLVTGPLRLGGFQHDVTAGEDALWLLHELDRNRSRLDRADLRTGRITGSVAVPGIADAVVVRPHAVWVATAAGSAVFRFDPRTLRRTLAVHIL
jgi:hypothetical protein